MKEQQNIRTYSGKKCNTKELDFYKALLIQGFSKQEIHSAIHKFMLLQIQHEKATGSKHNALYEKPSLFSKESHFLKSFISVVVSFIKTQFAKKPKNPV